MNYASYIANIPLLIWLLYLIYIRFSKVFHPALVIGVMAAKMLMAALLGAMYFFYYGYGDTIGYYFDSIVLTEIAKKDFSLYLQFLLKHDQIIFEKDPGHYFFFIFQHKAFFVAKMASLLNFLTFNNYLLNAFYFTLLPIYASLLICEKLLLVYPGKLIPALTSFVFFPSVFFWTSGLIKESIAVSMLFIFAAILIETAHTKKMSSASVVVLVLSSAVLLYFKYYIAAVFLPFLGLYLVVQYWFAVKLVVVRYGIILAGVIISYALLNQVAYRLIDRHLKLEILPQVLLDNNKEMLSNVEADVLQLHTYNDFSHIKPGYTSILIHSPEILFKGMFFPTVLHKVNLLQTIYSIENTLKLLLLIVAVLVFIIYPNPLRKDLLFYVLMSCVLICALLISLSCPNWGSLARLKAYYIPFISFYMMYLVLFVKEKYKSSYFYQ